jgi:molybdopterin-guanine dinucleotide biosynthesis protein A
MNAAPANGEAAVTLLVLNGGAGRRMGRDKAAIDAGGSPLGSRPVALLAAMVDEVIVAGRPLPGVDARCVADAVPGAGPLAGIVAGLEAASGDVVVVVACDMPEVRPELVALLVAGLRGAPGVTAAVCRSSRGLEPLPLAVRRDAAPQLRAALDEGIRALHEMIERVSRVIILPEEWRAADPEGVSFENWNRPDDVRPLGLIP